MAVDLSGIASKTAQLKGLQDALAATTNETAKAVLQAQITALSSQISADIAHAQQQQEAASNLIDGLNLWNTIQALGSSAPTIINLFRR